MPSRENPKNICETKHSDQVWPLKPPPPRNTTQIDASDFYLVPLGSVVLPNEPKLPKSRVTTTLLCFYCVS